MKKKIKLLCLLIALLLASACLLTCCNQNDDDDDKDDDGTVIPTPTPVVDETSIAIHYQRTDGDYSTWCYWIWVQDGGEGTIFMHNSTDDFGGVARYKLTDIGPNALQNGIGIIPRKVSGWVKDVDTDRLLDFADYEMDADKCYHVYIKQGDENLYKTMQEALAERITAATFVNENSIKVTATADMSSLQILENNTSIKTITEVSESISTIELPDSFNLDLGKTYTVKATFANGIESTCSVSVDKLYTLDSFNAKYAYDGDDLGAILSDDKTKTTFKVWSPISQSIKLNIYNQGDGNETPRTIDMTRGENGVWYHTENDNLAGKYYTYTVTNRKYPNGREIVDPYAKSAGLSGERGQIVDFDQIVVDGWTDDYLKLDRKSLVVYETHVADVTSSSTWNGTEAYRKKFLGMIESGTTYIEGGVTVTTGFDHIKELGVNAVQLLPIFDQANNETRDTFNWGYNPLNYNVVEGAYSTNPDDGYVRIKEFKQLVQAYKNEGIGIIMDVVYNHTSSNVGSNFDVLMPGYYYRYNANGSSSNGSGCGNETASENYMFRKFMIDSACFWAKEYNLAGFRFDLMGLHDVETMNLLVAALKEINPNIVVYGEPWTGGNTVSNEILANQSNANRYEGYGQFNDQGRDALIKGGKCKENEKGWVTSEIAASTDIAKILSALKGNTFAATSDPNKTVNYVTCHDNYTLYDRIKAAGIKDETTVKQMAMLANSVVFTSNGTSFMLAGEEFLRTKGGDHNSYKSSYETNELDYSLKIKNDDMFKNYQKLIELKKTASGLHLDASTIDGYTATASQNNTLITLTFKGVIDGAEREIKVVHANGGLPANTTVDFDGYTLYLDTLNVSGLTLSNTTPVLKYQTIIAYK